MRFWRCGRSAFGRCRLPTIGQYLQARPEAPSGVLRLRAAQRFSLLRPTVAKPKGFPLLVSSSPLTLSSPRLEDFAALKAARLAKQCLTCSFRSGRGRTARPDVRSGHDRERIKIPANVTGMSVKRDSTAEDEVRFATNRACWPVKFRP